MRVIEIEHLTRDYGNGKGIFNVSFTLFDANGIAAGDAGALTGTFALLAGAVAMYILGCMIFCKKDLCV